jgi:hypothetical protein
VSGEVEEDLVEGGLAGDGLDPVGTHLRLEFVGGPGGDDPAGVDDDDLVGQLIRLLEVLGRQQDGRAGSDERLDRGPDVDAGARVQAGGRFVEEQHRRSEDQAGGQVEPATHAAGVLGDRLVGRRGEVEPVE